MKKELIIKLFKRLEEACYIYQGLECWSARELQELFGYSKWEIFEKVIIKAKAVCSTARELVEDHFPDVRKMVEIGSK